MSGNVQLHDLADETIEYTRAQGSKMLGPGGFFECGKVEWPGLIRKLERERGTSYRT